jgi:hypothetical protein
MLFPCPNCTLVAYYLEMGGWKDGTFDLATKSFGTFVVVDQLECGGSMSMADPRPCRNAY